VVTDSVDGPGKISSSPPRNFIVHVSGDTVVDGEHWAAIDSLGQLEYDAQSPVVNYLTNRANGVYIAGSTLTTFSLPPLVPAEVLSNLYLKFPANPGDAAVPPRGTNPPYVQWAVADTGVVITPPGPVTSVYRIVKLTSYSPGPH
jgi:hypothetical protein